jgi:hypothetical protein
MNFLDGGSSDSFAFLILLLTVIASAVVLFLYLKNLSGLLSTIREPNRAMAPNGVWYLAVTLLNNLLSIPIYYYLEYGSTMVTVLNTMTYMIAIFAVYWHYKIVMAIAISIEAEYDSRSIPIEHKPTLQTGMFMIVAQALVLIREVPFIGVIGKFAAWGYIIGLILYWVRTYKFKKEIAAMSVSQDEDSLIFKDLL